MEAIRALTMAPKPAEFIRREGRTEKIGEHVDDWRNSSDSIIARRGKLSRNFAKFVAINTIHSQAEAIVIQLSLMVRILPPVAKYVSAKAKSPTMDCLHSVGEEHRR